MRQTEILDENCTGGFELLERWMVRFMVVTHLITIICATSVEHSTTIDLKEELGPMYDSYIKRLTELKVMYLKEMITAKPADRDQVRERWREIMHQHASVHSPGSLEQLKQTWREDDEMDDDSYSAQALFRTHDYDNDGFLTGDEIRALYYSQLLKGFPDSTPEEDLLREVMSIGMLGKILQKVDTDKDGRISYFELAFFIPVPDEGFEAMDESELPDLEHAKDDPMIVEAVQKDLEEHPNDTASEELMHKISDKEVLHGMNTADAYSSHKSHDHATPQPATHGS